MNNELVVAGKRERVCALCGAHEGAVDVLTQPAGQFRIGGLPGSEAIAQDAKWVDICFDHIGANNRVLDAAYAKATGRRARGCAPRLPRGE
jgi:hypothetical protein